MEHLARLIMGIAVMGIMASIGAICGYFPWLLPVILILGLSYGVGCWILDVGD